MASERREEAAMTVEEFTDQLADDLDEDAEALRTAAAEVEIAPPWEAEIEPRGDTE